MKKILRNNEGYILPYVLVVVAVVSLIAVAACTTAIRNYKTQTQALSYSQDKYVAEGIVERFVIELQNAAVEVAEEVASRKVGDETGYHAYHDEVKDAISGGLRLRLGDEDITQIDGIIDGILYDGYVIDLKADIYDFVHNTYVAVGQGNFEEIQSDPDSGYFKMTADLSAYSGDVRVDADIEMLFEAELRTESISGVSGETKVYTYYISGVTFEYTSYDLTLSSEGRTGR